MAHVLERCGAQASDLSSLAEAQRNLLFELGNGWDSPLELADRCLNSECAKTFYSSLTEALDKQQVKECGLACVHGMERILPIWQAALEKKNQRIQHLLVVRHPLAAVEQFRSDEGWGRDRALLVWLQSTLAMERHSRNFSRVVVDGEQLAWDLDGTLNQIENTLKLTLPERHHKSLIELEQDSSSKTDPISIKTLAQAPNKAAGSLLLTMALQLHNWLLAGHETRERQRHLPDAIREQITLAESIMGRTLNDLSLQNSSLKDKLQLLEKRKSLRFSNWIQRRRQEVA